MHISADMNKSLYNAYLHNDTFRFHDEIKCSSITPLNGRDTTALQHLYLHIISFERQALWLKSLISVILFVMPTSRHMRHRPYDWSILPIASIPESYQTS